MQNTLESESARSAKMNTMGALLQIRASRFASPKAIVSPQSREVPVRELNRFGITSVDNAGGGLENYPGDYEVVRGLHERGELTVRLAYNLFRQEPKETGRIAAVSTLSTPPQERAKVAEVIEQAARKAPTD